ncbi:N-acetylmuramoyl-L-alanine amidase [Rickettsiales endosymbiont of Trichoplax sp. H2]|uniref:N-acetylmuramoyl-L-alanine amidase n=1 Tax=Rickettsiales endosymbiont of Trichoplax sp. H2 TaxID=2021221 RepID=UPI0012B39BCB|nr:N-acetylmuramoyl-L-alanine amidase [Rickettsiales endosymbiont of Trichoplax sp. H2]MSO14373.1 N-acetylmuramoyl-L-alanine amidase AmiD [Rickettsiales endosymbiont of Trichoplax sp. H2]
MYHKIKLNTKYSNYSKRKFGSEINTIIIHYTELGFKDSYNILTKSGKVSSHFLISEKGDIHQLVPLEFKAWHAGESFWSGKNDINQYSIGIEIVNKGMKLKFLNNKVQVLNINTFSNNTYFALAKLICELKKMYPKIQDKNIIGHSDITARNLRKIDPGISFDWKFLNILGHGIYHEIEKRDNNKIIFKLGDKGQNIELLQNKLQKLGYEINYNGLFDKHLANVIFAFNLHYLQHINITTNQINYGIWDIHSEKVLEKVMCNLS